MPFIFWVVLQKCITGELGYYQSKVQLNYICLLLIPLPEFIILYNEESFGVGEGVGHGC